MNLATALDRVPGNLIGRRWSTAAPRPLRPARELRPLSRQIGPGVMVQKRAVADSKTYNSYLKAE